MKTSYSINIEYNSTINPCILTPKGNFSLNTHSFYIICDSSSDFYKIYGWFLGTVQIGKNLHDIPKEKLSAILKQIRQNQNITCDNIRELGTQLYHRIARVCQELQINLPDKRIQVEGHRIRVPEISDSFNTCIKKK